MTNDAQANHQGIKISTISATHNFGGEIRDGKDLDSEMFQESMVDECNLSHLCGTGNAPGAATRPGDLDRDTINNDDLFSRFWGVDRRCRPTSRTMVSRGWKSAGLVVFVASMFSPECQSFTVLPSTAGRGFACVVPSSSSTPALTGRCAATGLERQMGVRGPLIKMTASARGPTKDDAEKQVRGRGLKRGLKGSSRTNSVPVSRETTEDEDEEYVGTWGTEGAERLVLGKSDDDWTVWLNHGFPTMLNTISALSDARASARKAAVGQLLKCAAEHPAGPNAPWAVAALVGRMDDDSACVREAAVRGLVKISEKGNKAVVLAMAYLIEEENSITVKKAALQALPRLANRGDEEALAPVMKVLQRVQGHERGDIYYPHVSRMLSKHAVKALGTLAGRGNEEVLKALHVRILDDPEPSVREAAARSIGNLAEADDARSVAALMLCMEDEDEVVRRTALKSTRTMLRRQREEQMREAIRSVDEDKEEDEDHEEECGASRLWLLPGVWGG